ncbi:MAG: S41 family peptidase, partial [Rikenellaceae bacterium]
TGSGYTPSTTPATTASLGLFYDQSFVGDGLKISEVIEGSPFDNSKSKIKAGDVITAINGNKILANENYDKLFEGIDGKKTLVTYNDGKRSIDEVVYPISKGSESTLLYNRWVKEREKMVDSLSGGRLGYVHIDGMDDSEFRKVYSAVLGKYNFKDGIVIDIRFNRGGRLHEDIEVLFSGEEYLMQVVRGIDYCAMPSRRYTKPSVMVVNEACYSNAHGTPWVYRYKKMGQIVGMPVAGTMTSVEWETLQDESLYFGIPEIGYRKADGTYLENFELEPDVKVQNTPESLSQGKDLQLEAAVKSLLKTIYK